MNLTVIDSLAHTVHENAVMHGWWDDPHDDGELIALIHSEASEALEALRHGNQPSDHIPAFSGLEEELADIIIRVLDMACARGCRIGDAIAAKHAFNVTRPIRHGGKAF